MKTKPNLVGIGGQKCASTWLYECLRSHPEIFMSSPKELRYFSENENKGLAWYLEFFERADKSKYSGEFSSNYIYLPESAQKIKAVLGEVKIIAVVREPAGRSLSHIKHLIRNGDLPQMTGQISKQGLERILEQHPKVLLNSFYQPGLKKYRETFGQLSMFVVNQALCRNQGKHVLKVLWEFLGVNTCVDISEATQVISAGVNPRSLRLERLRIQVFSFLKYRAPGIINWAKKAGLSSLYRKINRGEDLEFGQDAHQHLYALCKDDWGATQNMFAVK